MVIRRVAQKDLLLFSCLNVSVRRDAEQGTDSLYSDNIETFFLYKIVLLVHS